MIGTDRLILRPWRDADRASYAAMMADPQVGYWLGGTLTADQANAQVDRFIAQRSKPEPGWLALQRRADDAFVGAAVLRQVIGDDHPLRGQVEIGWRLARTAWGFGYAAESARALLRFGFETARLKEVVAFTAATNLRSQAVMERIGLQRRPDLDFDHPALGEDHPLRPHQVWSVSP